MISERKFYKVYVTDNDGIKVPNEIDSIEFSILREAENEAIRVLLELKEKHKNSDTVFNYSAEIRLYVFVEYVTYEKTIYRSDLIDQDDQLDLPF